MDEELSPRDRHRIGVPTGGRWFHHKYPILTLVTNGDQFLVAWDISKNSDAKCFGIYPSFEEFWSNYLRVPPNRRWGYEVVRKDKPAKIYFDIEYWTTDGDTEHTKLFMFVDYIRKRLGEQSPVPPEINYVIGTRPDKGKIKDSYHVVVDNFVCRNNHDDGTMLQLAKETTQLGDEWKTVKPNGKIADIVDTSVYKKEQLIRLPLSAKRSSKHPRPFHILSEDGYDHEQNREPEDRYDMYDAEHFYISNPDHNGDRIPFETDLINVAPKKTKTKEDKKPKQQTHTDQAAEPPLQTEDYPFTIDDIQSLLATCGDTVSQVYSVTRPDPDRDEYTIKCNQRKQSRPCLHNPTIVHDSNTMWLYAIRDGDRYRIEYHCFGSECSKLRNKTIGHVQAISHAQTTDDSTMEDMLYNMSTNDNELETEPQETDTMEVEPPMPTHRNHHCI